MAQCYSQKNSQTLVYEIRDCLYLNVSDRCTLACSFCPKIHSNDYQLYDYNLKLEQLPSADDVISAIKNPASYREVVFCGFGEPTLRLNVVLEVADYIKQHQGKVRLNTDGLASHVSKRNVLPEMKGLIDTVSVSLNAQNKQLYNKHCQPAVTNSFEAMLLFLKTATSYIPTVFATAIDGLDGVDIVACERLANDCGAVFRGRKLDAIG